MSVNELERLCFGVTNGLEYLLPVEEGLDGWPFSGYRKSLDTA